MAGAILQTDITDIKHKQAMKALCPNNYYQDPGLHGLFLLKGRAFYQQKEKR
jgi:hypothetical protein